jgi:polyhydroxyalkanoate synthesis regulator phasin
MTEEEKTEGEGADEQRSRKGKMEDGIKQGIGVLSAFKDALEETIQEARDRGDLSTDRAKEVMKDALDRAQSAAEGARDKLDFAQQSEMEGLMSAMDSIKARVSSLEESVFGSAKDDDADDVAAGKGEETES